MPSRFTSTGRVLALGNDATAWLSLLQANATYAWDGVQGLTLATWTDVVQGVVATAFGGGSITLDTYNGRAAALLPGETDGQRYKTASLASLSQPYAVVLACGSTTALQFQTWCDGQTKDTLLMYQNPTGAARMYAGTLGPRIDSGATLPSVFLAIFNGASSSLSRNGGAAVTGDPGANGFNGVTIGGRAELGTSFKGLVMHYSLYHGAKLANAATVAAAARQYYGI